ncbi:MAG: MerR family transcriptional regulator [bacterium]|nr:MerR family transcriptional regulator [bacterium]
MKNMLYKIGEFSKLANIPIKTLRYYDEINLFKPKEIDLFSGYRYYSEEQLKDLKIILSLKEVGFSLEEIKKNKNNYSDELMRHKKTELIAKEKAIEEQIKKIDYLRSKIKDNKIILDGNISADPKRLERLR